MERGNMFMNEGNNNIMPYGIMARQNELNGITSSEQLQNCFFNPSWDNSGDQNDPFESAISSMVSSPATMTNAGASAAAPPPPPGSARQSFVLSEVIGRLGSICNSSEVSPHLYMGGNNSTSTSCYATPQNSPPKLNLSMVDHQIKGNSPFPGNHLPMHPSMPPVSADTAFEERTARYLPGLHGHIASNGSEFPQKFAPKMDSGKISRALSNQSFKVSETQMNVSENKKFTTLSRPSTPENSEFGDSRENSSVSEQIPGGEIGRNGRNDVNSRKRKSISKGKGKDVLSSTSAKDVNAAAENNESSAKRSKADEDNANDKAAKLKAEQNGSAKAAGDGNEKENKDKQKPQEPPKDYIHVRARRGQATDAHSLAERVRREKISQRMKFLQDLVPGCNKVTGKAVMLDEIINYVQSLQRQVEFLSMKLSAINPRMDVNLEALLSKDMVEPRGSLPRGAYASDTSASALPFSFQLQQVPNLHSSIPDGTKVPLSMNHMNADMDGNLSLQLQSADSLSETAAQASTFWEDDLQSIVFGQNQAQNLQGDVSTAQMKIEL